MKIASVLNFIITLQKFTPQANCKRKCGVKVDAILNGRINRGIWNSGKPYKRTIRTLNKVLTLCGFFTAHAHVQVSWENLKESTRKTKA